MTVEFIGAELSGNHEIYEKRADWLDRQVSKLVLGQTSTTDAQKGSYAVGAVQDRVRDDIEKADAKALAATLNRDLVRPLIDLNFGPQKVYPKLRIGRPEAVDLQQFMPAVKTFVSMGGKVSMSVVRDKLGLPDPGADEELLVAGAPSAVEPPAADGGRQAAFAAQRKSGDGIDAGVQDALDDWQPLVAPIVAGLEAEIAAAASLGDVERILARRFADMDLGALTEELARAVFAARLAGEGNEKLS
jgi:phage gp29-like protein